MNRVEKCKLLMVSLVRPVVSCSVGPVFPHTFKIHNTTRSSYYYCYYYASHTYVHSFSYSLLLATSSASRRRRRASASCWFLINSRPSIAKSSELVVACHRLCSKRHSAVVPSNCSWCFIAA